MSFHNHDRFPEYNHGSILSGLRAHGLSTSEPSQLSDAFRSGYKYAEIEIEGLRDALTRIQDLTQHNMGMSARDETCVHREASKALSPKEPNQAPLEQGPSIETKDE